MRRLGPSEQGGALVEFTWLAVLLMVPLVYVLLCVFQVQRAAFAVTEGARQGGRAFAVASDADSGQARAEIAVGLAMADQGITDLPVTDVRCAQTCLTPGSSVTVQVDLLVRLPVLSLLFPGDQAPGIPVSATHVAVVDGFRAGP